MSNKVHWGVAAVLCGFSAAMAFSISYAMMNRRFEEMLQADLSSEELEHLRTLLKKLEENIR